MKISLLRHGKTTSDGIYRGHTDVALTKQGLMQMHNTAKTFQVPVDYLVTSNLQRCAKFAAQLEPKEHIDERFQEMSFGDWDGKDRAEIWRTQPDKVEQFWNDPMHCSAPNGETVTQLQDRAMSAFDEHIKNAIKLNSKHMLIVTHGGVIRAMVGSILHMQAKGMFNLNLPYASVVPLHVICFENDQGQPDYHVSVDFCAA